MIWGKERVCEKNGLPLQMYVDESIILVCYEFRN